MGSARISLRYTADTQCWYWWIPAIPACLLGFLPREYRKKAAHFAPPSPSFCSNLRKVRVQPKEGEFVNRSKVSQTQNVHTPDFRNYQETIEIIPVSKVIQMLLHSLLFPLKYFLWN